MRRPSGAQSSKIRDASLWGSSTREQRARRDPRGAVDLGDAQGDVVDVAPAPVLAWLERADDRVLVGARVGGRVAVGRVVAAADVPAFEADAQVQPLPA